MKSTLMLTILAASLLSYASNATADKTILAGGCFWCMESDFEKLDGVSDVISGFTGGSLKDPTYNGNHAGHFEAVQITYDPNKVSYKELLDYYWVNIDQERQIAEQSKSDIEKQFPNQKVVTPILASSVFYPIKGDESYHQDYYKNNPIRYHAYRWNCGRDQRLEEIWGDKATH